MQPDRDTKIIAAIFRRLSGGREGDEYELASKTLRTWRRCAGRSPATRPTARSAGSRSCRPRRRPSKGTPRWCRCSTAGRTPERNMQRRGGTRDQARAQGGGLRSRESGRQGAIRCLPGLSRLLEDGDGHDQRERQEVGTQGGHQSAHRGVEARGVTGVIGIGGANGRPRTDAERDRAAGETRAVSPDFPGER
jgi:hypothetical protein